MLMGPRLKCEAGGAGVLGRYWDVALLPIAPRARECMGPSAATTGRPGGGSSGRFEFGIGRVGRGRAGGAARARHAGRRCGAHGGKSGSG